MNLPVEWMTHQQASVDTPGTPRFHRESLWQFRYSCPVHPDGAWGFHKTIIPGSPRKPIRLFISVGDRDLLNPNVMRDGMHDWVEASHQMAKVLKAKGYEYQYLFCRGSGHGIDNAKAPFLPHAIEWVWRGYGSREIK